MEHCPQQKNDMHIGDLQHELFHKFNWKNMENTNLNINITPYSTNYDIFSEKVDDFTKPNK